MSSMSDARMTDTDGKSGRHYINQELLTFQEDDTSQLNAVKDDVCQEGNHTRNMMAKTIPEKHKGFKEGKQELADIGKQSPQRTPKNAQLTMFIQPSPNL
jgi:hypothetical protein